MGREHTRSSPWVHRSNPAFPHTVVLTVSSVISPVIGFVVTLALRSPAKLDASVEASGPHDFAVRVQHRSSAGPSTSIASRPASVTIASAPWWDETARLGRCFASNINAFIFVVGAGQVICPSGTERCGAVALAHTAIIASAAKQSSFERQAGIGQAGLLRRFTPRNDGVRYNGNDREWADSAVIASAAKQSSFERQAGLLRRFAPRNDEVRHRGMKSAWSAHSMQGADLVAVWIAQIGQVDFYARAFAHARRIFTGRCAVCAPGGVPGVGLLGRTGGNPNGPAVRGRRGFSIDRL